jgi:uncharacterized repeat protein (TIGR03803 family)
MRTERPVAWLLVAAVAVAGGILSAGAQSTPAPALAVQVTPLGPVAGDLRQVAASPEGRVALVSSIGSRQSLFIDGIEGPVFSSIKMIPTTTTGKIPLISADSQRVAYLASPQGGQWCVVVNHVPGPMFDDIRQGKFAPAGHKLMYVGMRNVPDAARMTVPQYFVVVDGAIGPPCRTTHQLEFSPDGMHAGWSATVEHGMQVVVDGRAGPVLPGISQLKVGNGGHYAYFVQVDSSSMVAFTDGQPGPKFGLVDNLVMSADGKHVGYRATIGSAPLPRWVAVIDGRPGGEFVGLGIPQFSPDGLHFAYSGSANAPSQRGLLTYAIVDGKRSQEFDEVDKFTFSPDSSHIAYIAKHNGQELVVFDGRDDEAHQGIDRQSLRFSADSKRFAYVAQDKDGHIAVVDGKPGEKRMNIDGQTLEFSPDGQHYKYRSRGPVSEFWVMDDQKPADGEYPKDMVTTADWHHVATAVLKQSGEVGEKAMRVFLDGKPVGREYALVEQLTLSPDGAHLAFVAYAPGGEAMSRSHVVIDGREGPGYRTVQRILWSPDSQHVAYAAEEGVQLHVVVDDFPGPLYDGVMGTYAQQPAGLGFRPDGSLEFVASADKKLARYVYTPAIMAALPKAPPGGAAGAPGYSEIHRFGETENDGATPQVLAAGKDGTLFGATSKGSEWKKGALFTLKPDGSAFTVLHPFEGNMEDGEYPTALIAGPDASIYGSTRIGGPTNNGTIFRVQPDGSGYKVVHAAQSGEYGATLMAVDHAGFLYTFGGPPNRPTISRMKPDGTDLKPIYSPERPSQEKSAGPFTDGGDGYLYGVGVASIFKVKTDGGDFGVVRMFAGQPRDINSADVAPMMGHDGVLYGFARSGGLGNGGVIYKVNKDGSNYSLLVNPKNDQLHPAGLADGPDNRLYAIVREGIASVSKDGKEYKVVQKMDGGGFAGTLVCENGALFGVLTSGGKGNGSIFRYGFGGGNAAAAPTLAMQIVPPKPLDFVTDTPTGNMPAPASNPPQEGIQAPSNAAQPPAPQPTPQQPVYSWQQPAGASPQPAQPAPNTPPPPQQQPNYAQQPQQQPPQQQRGNPQNRGQNQVNRALDDARKAQDAANALKGLFGR